MPPTKMLNLDPLRLLLTQSGTRLLFNTCDKTIVTILNSRFLGGEIVAEGEIPAPPRMKPCCGNLYKHPRAKHKGVHGFQGDPNLVGPRFSSYKAFIP